MADLLAPENAVHLAEQGLTLARAGSIKEVLQSDRDRVNVARNEAPTPPELVISRFDRRMVEDRQDGDLFARRPKLLGDLVSDCPTCREPSDRVGPSRLY